MDNFEALVEQLPHLLGEKFDTAHKQALGAVLKTRAVQLALAKVLFERSVIAANLINVDLTSDQGKLNATREQGRARGIQWTVERLFELTEVEEENEDDNAE